jgi:hypothetical protein
LAAREIGAPTRCIKSNDPDRATGKHLRRLLRALEEETLFSSSLLPHQHIGPGWTGSKSGAVTTKLIDKSVKRSGIRRVNRAAVPLVVL